MTSDFFDAAVARHSRKVFTLAAYLLGDAGDAEEIAQEVLIKLGRRGSGVEPERVRDWMLQVTRNACIDQLRRRRRAAEVIAIRSHEAAPFEGPGREPGPEQIAAGAELGRRISKALNGLSENARSVVILREIQGLSYNEISEVVGISTSSVRVTLHRARRRLRELLKEVHPHVAAG